MADDERIKDYLLAVDTADWALVRFSDDAISRYGGAAERVIADCRRYIKAYRRHVISTAVEQVGFPVLSEIGYRDVVDATSAIRTFASQGDWHRALGSVDHVLSVLPGSPSLPPDRMKFASVMPGEDVLRPGKRPK